MKTKIKDLLQAALAELEQEDKPAWTLTRHLPGFRPLRDGEEWHRQDWTEDMLAGGWRPLLHGETTVEDLDEYFYSESYGPLKWEKIYGLAGEQVGVTWSYRHEHAFVRTRRPLPEPAKVVPWDGPEDVPKPVCWVRVKDRLDIWASLEAMVIAVSNTSMTVQCRDLQHICWRDVEDIKKIEYSTDRINWKPCTKEVAP